MTVRQVVVDHVLFVVADLQQARQFYEAALAPLGFRVMYEQGDCVSFGLDKADDFAICQGDEAPTTKAHVAFVAESREAVDAFFQAAMANGGREKMCLAKNAWLPTWYPLRRNCLPFRTCDAISSNACQSICFPQPLCSWKHCRSPLTARWIGAPCRLRKA